jgi:hypothetical protein
MPNSVRRKAVVPFVTVQMALSKSSNHRRTSTWEKYSQVFNLVQAKIVELHASHTGNLFGLIAQFIIDIALCRTARP